MIDKNYSKINWIKVKWSGERVKGVVVGVDGIFIVFFFLFV